MRAQRNIRIAFAIMTLTAMCGAANAQSVNLYAAGSLKAAMEDMIAAFASASPVKVSLVTGPSGLLRERIEKGEPAHVFASADTGHPQRLSDQARTSDKPVVFARNQLCALVREGVKATSETLLDVMLDPGIRLGTSTPKSDPSGDYAFALFAKADIVRGGTKANLEGKALTLTGGTSSEQPPAGRNVYGWMIESGKAAVFLAYCTAGIVARREVPSIAMLAIPPSLAVGADYGLVVIKDAPPTATALAAFIRSHAGRQVLARHGFGAGD